MVTNNEQWLKDIVNNDDLQFGKLNLITAPCHSGKTEWAKTLNDNRITIAYEVLYLIDSARGKESLKKRFGTYIENWYDNTWELVTKGMRIMTYAGWMYCMLKNPDGWHFTSNTTIICDELDSCIRYSTIKDDALHTQAICELHKRIKNKSNLVVAITATPNRVIKEFKSDIFNVPLAGVPKHDNNKHEIKYSNIKNIFNQLDLSKRGVIYFPHITQIQAYEMIFRSMGINAVGIWSVNNREHPMDTNNEELSEYILSKEEIPDDVQILLINASSQTCININTHIDWMVINDTDTDVQTQARGRIRGDIDTIYLLDRKAKCNISAEQVDKYLGKKLYKEDKDKLVAEIAAVNENNRKIGWTTIKRELIEMGYEIKDKRINHGSIIVTTINYSIN